MTRKIHIGDELWYITGGPAGLQLEMGRVTDLTHGYSTAFVHFNTGRITPVWQVFETRQDAEANLGFRDVP